LYLCEIVAEYPISVGGSLFSEERFDLPLKNANIKKQQKKHKIDKKRPYVLTGVFHRPPLQKNNRTEAPGEKI